MTDARHNEQAVLILRVMAEALQDTSLRITSTEELDKQILELVQTSVRNATPAAATAHEVLKFCKGHGMLEGEIPHDIDERFAARLERGGLGQDASRTKPFSREGPERGGHGR